MSGSLNKQLLIGNLGKDPELRYTPGGTPVCTFPMATNQRWTNRDGKKMSRTDWHNIVVYGKLAENCSKFLNKGRTVYAEGPTVHRSWDREDGSKGYRTEVKATEVQFLGGVSLRTREADQTELPLSDDVDDCPF